MLSGTIRVGELVDGDRSMVITVITVRMAQDPLREIVLVVSVRNQRVTTPLVSTRAGDRSAPGGIARVHFQHMFIVVPLVQRMEVTIVQIVCMAVMGKRKMPTMLSMDMGMLLVSGMVHQQLLS
jgi:hypothetical protein